MRELIGAGSSAEVWALDSHRALKLFFPEVGNATIDREYAAAGIAHAAGLPVAEPITRLMEGDRQGIVFDRISGTCLLKVLMRQPQRMWLQFRQMARYQNTMHHCVIEGGLPTVHELVRHGLSQSLADSSAIAEAARALARLPAGNCLGHGDFHPGNVVVSSSGLVAVDWSKAWIGPPAADVARTELLIRFGLDRTGSGSAVPAIARRISAWWYRQCYQRVSGLSPAEIDAWRLPLAIAWQRGQSHCRSDGLHTAIERWRRDDRARNAAEGTYTGP